MSTEPSIPTRTLVALACVALSGCNCDDELGRLNASVTVEPETLDFGRVPVNSQKTVQLTIKNRGSFIATVSDFIADVPFVAPTLTSTDVRTFNEVQVDVAMRPTAVGMATGTLVFTTNDPDAPEIMVPLIGEGIEAAVTVMPPIVDFGEVLWDSQTVAPSIDVTVTNPGTDSFDLSNFILENDGAGAFSVEPMGIEKTFGPGESSMFRVTYNPNAMGMITGRIKFDTTTAAAPQIEVPIMALAVGPEMEVCASEDGAAERCTAAGEVPVVQMLNVDRMGSASGTIRVLNVGNRPLTVQSQLIRVEDEFTFSPTPMGLGQIMLAPNDAQSLTVTYNPADYEFDLETLIFAGDSATRPTASVGIRGEVGRPQVRVEPGRLTFQQTGAAPPARVSVALSNCGTLPLTTNGAVNLRVVSGGNAFTLENTPGGGTTLPMEDCNMPPQRVMTFNVVFDPPGDGTFEAEIDVPTNDPVNPVFVVMVSGVRR